jgi:hypothetical protein
MTQNALPIFIPKGRFFVAVSEKRYGCLMIISER